MTDLWTRLADGRSVALVGGILPERPPHVDVLAVHVRCAGARRPLGPLLDAEERALALLGDPGPDLLDVAAERVRDGLRRRLLGGRPVVDRVAAVVATLNRLRSSQPAVLVLDAVDHADPATLGALSRVLARPGWLTLPVLLGFRDEPHGAAAEVLRAFEVAFGDACVVRGDLLPELAEWGTLPPLALRVLRAGAVAGAGFDVEVVGSLLGLDPVEVLEILQVAADRGVPLSDDGYGHLSLPAALADSLRESVMPSLRAAWHRRLGEILAPIEPGLEDAAEAREALGLPEHAAEHALRAGDVEDAATRFATAGADALRIGAFEQAAELLGRADGLVAGLPDNRERRVLRAHLLLDAAHAMELAAGGPDGTFGLEDADAALATADALLFDTDEHALRAEVLRARAHVRYERGDPVALEEALDELTGAIRLLAEANRAVDAAMLLNDQAAVYLRLGDPVRAAHLLRESREVFEGRAATDAHAAFELAETDHLLARLPFYVGARDGHEDDALDRAMGHARRAIDGYVRLGADREALRAEETMARLMLRQGLVDEATTHLVEVYDAQRRLPDLFGIARTADALAEALTEGGRFEQALDVLVRSVAVNREKGSPAGVAFNARSLRRLVDAMPPGHARSLRREIQEVEALIVEAQDELGVVDLPVP